MELPRKIAEALTMPLHSRYRVLYGGRGSGKSWSIAKMLIMIACSRRVRILCAREYQISMADSVHKLLSEQIEELGLSAYFEIQKTTIKCTQTDSEFIFRGLHHNANEIKSMEGLDYVWIEEAEKVSEESWSLLVPTVRKEHSEIWVSFNPHRQTDPTYQRFIKNTPPNCVLCKVNANDNPWFPDVLRAEMEWDRKTNTDKYLWVWAGNPVGISAAQVFRGKYFVDVTPEPNDNDRLFFGADWGFANDPTAIIRCFVRDRILYIDQEIGGVGIEIDELPALFSRVPAIDKWPIYADCARPETISYVKRKGYAIKGAPKWQGSIEDGIAYIKSFERIIINPRCKNMIQEMELYQYKQDRLTGDILPIIVDANNHYQDALRYALADYIKSKEFAFSL